MVKLWEKLKRPPSYVSLMVRATRPPEAPFPHATLQKPEFAVSDNGERGKAAVRDERECSSDQAPKDIAV
jgi:hypothetical protein